jgi:hypothetical protein
MSELTETELTLEERAMNALNQLAKNYPAAESVARGEVELPEWMGQPWLPQLTDPSDPEFASAVIKAEAWLQDH